MLSWQSMPSAASRAARGVRPARPPHRFEGMVIALALIAVVGLAVAEHGIFLAHAGALERDESNSAAYATMPSLGAIWSELRYDTVPLASTLLFRSWGGVGLGSDGGLRVLGFLIGIGILGAFWIHARLHDAPFPAFPLLLLGFHSYAVRFTDAVRPMGLGVLAILLFAAFLWRALRAPSVARALAAAAFAVLSVHSLYPDLALVAGLCFAGVVYGLARRSPACIVSSAAAGLIAALSLLIYLPALRASAAWSSLMRAPLNLKMLAFALDGTGRPGAALWIAAVLAGLVAWGVRARRPGTGTDPLARAADSHAAWFAGTALVACAASFLLLLRISQLGSKPWYYLPPLAITAACLDALVAPALRRAGPRLIAALALLVFSVWHFTEGRGLLELRQTNLDRVAATLEAEAGPRDLIVVVPWAWGVTFHRYYRGRVPWIAVPPIEDSRIHRFDLLRRRMEAGAAADTVLRAIAATLAAGGRVWLAGLLPEPTPGAMPPAPPPAPAPGIGWDQAFYATRWGLQVSTFLLLHAGDATRVPVSTPGPVSPAEDTPLVCFVGWR